MTWRWAPKSLTIKDILQIYRHVPTTLTTLIIALVSKTTWTQENMKANFKKINITGKVPILIHQEQNILVNGKMASDLGLAKN